MSNHRGATVSRSAPTDTTSQGQKAAIPPIEACEALISAQVAISETAVTIERHRHVIRGISRACAVIDKELGDRINHLTSNTLPEVRQAATRLDLYAQARNRRTA